MASRRQDFRDYVEEMAKSMMEAAKTHDLKKVFLQVNRLTGRQPAKKAPAVDETGKALQGAAEQAELFRRTAAEKFA